MTSQCRLPDAPRELIPHNKFMPCVSTAAVKQMGLLRNHNTANKTFQLVNQNRLRSLIRIPLPAPSYIFSSIEYYRMRYLHLPLCTNGQKNITGVNLGIPPRLIKSRPPVRQRAPASWSGCRGGSTIHC